MNAPSHVHTAYRSDYFSVCLHCFIALRETEVRVETEMLMSWMKEREGRRGREKTFYYGGVFTSMLTLFYAVGGRKFIV